MKKDKGYIKEPKNVDFYVDPTPLKKIEMDLIHEAIAYYNTTGKIMAEPLVQYGKKKKHRVKNDWIPPNATSLNLGCMRTNKTHKLQPKEDQWY